MPKKIETLTAAQAAELPAFRRRYLDLACDGRRADRERLHAALADAYGILGKPKPVLQIVSSPAAGMLALAVLRSAKGSFNQKGRDQLGDQLGDQLRDQLGDQLRDQLRDQLWAQLGDQLGAQLWAQLGDQLWDQLRDQLGAQLWDQLGAQLRDQLREDKRGSIWNGNFLWGSQDLFWIAWARFAQKIGVSLKPETDRRLGIAERIASECEWWWPTEGIVVASERPVTVKFDDMRRLHCEDGPAVAYADGYALWSWHGVRVPQDWIAQRAITAQDALTWPNIEQRRAACEILGWATILARLDARTIDRDADAAIGELLEVEIPDIGREKFLRVRCGTGREFALPVPPDMRSALQANAWTYGLDANQYQPEVRT